MERVGYRLVAVIGFLVSVAQPIWAEEFRLARSAHDVAGSGRSVAIVRPNTIGGQDTAGPFHRRWPGRLYVDRVPQRTNHID
jgi:hypothetical protein